jgi:hypothetical protein
LRQKLACLRRSGVYAPHNHGEARSFKPQTRGDFGRESFGAAVGREQRLVEVGKQVEDLVRQRRGKTVFGASDMKNGLPVALSNFAQVVKLPPGIIVDDDDAAVQGGANARSSCRS